MLGSRLARFQGFWFGTELGLDMLMDFVNLRLVTFFALHALLSTYMSNHVEPYILCCLRAGIGVHRAETSKVFGIGKIQEV